MSRGVVTASVLLVCVRSAGAHPAPFSYLDLHLDDTGVSASLVVHDFDVAHDLGVDPPTALLDELVASRYRDRLAALLASRLEITIDGARVPTTWGGLDVLRERQSLRLALRVDVRPRAFVSVIAALFPYDPVHQTFVNVYERGRLQHQAVLDQRRPAITYYRGTTQGTLAVWRTFVPAGIQHILIGPDHVLFLVGLLLLGGTVGRLAGIVTAFTIGHSVTLSLAALGLVNLPASVVEPTIALSLVLVGVDNLLVQKGGPSGSAAVRIGSSAHRDIRPWVAAVFGLVHGFGFASVLEELGVPASALAASLFSFNVGVEVGQLAIVVVVASTLTAVRRRSVRASEQLAFAGSLGVIVAGGTWFVQRVLLGGA